jgi:hypothetical protein
MEQAASRYPWEAFEIRREVQPYAATESVRSDIVDTSIRDPLTHDRWEEQ